MEFLNPNDVRLAPASLSTSVSSTLSSVDASSKAENNATTHHSSLTTPSYPSNAPSVLSGFALPNNYKVPNYVPPNYSNNFAYPNNFPSTLATMTAPNLTYNPNAFAGSALQNTNLLGMYSDLGKLQFPPSAISAPAPFVAPMATDRSLLQSRRNSIPFTFSNLGEGAAPIVSGSFSAGADKQWLEQSRMRHTQSLEKDVNFGCYQTTGTRPKMEDVFDVVPFTGQQGKDVVGLNLLRPPTLSAGFTDLPTPSQAALRTQVVPSRKERRPSIGYQEADPMDRVNPKRAKLGETSSPSGPTKETSPASSNSTEKIKSEAVNSPVVERPKKPSYAFFAVYDGHGGTGCAEYVRMNLHANISNHEAFNTDVERAIVEGFAKTEEDFAAEGGHPGCGTTACVALIYNSVLYVANVGDSAAIICRKGTPIELTNAHTLKSDTEKERIEACGGVAMDGRLAHPIWNPKLINIGVTRALGDMYFKDEQYTLGKASGLISEPEIKRFPLTHDDRFILLGTDGFWDQISHQDAVDFVLKEKGLNARVVCKKLTDLVAKRSDQLSDNATVLLVKLKGDEDDTPAPSPPVTPALAPLPAFSSTPARTATDMAPPAVGEAAMTNSTGKTNSDLPPSTTKVSADAPKVGELPPQEATTTPSIA